MENQIPAPPQGINYEMELTTPAAAFRKSVKWTMAQLLHHTAPFPTTTEQLQVHGLVLQ